MAEKDNNTTELTDEQKTRLKELQADPRYADVSLMVDDIIENTVIPRHKERQEKGEPSIFDLIFGPSK